MDVREEYHNRCVKQMLQLKDLYKKADQGQWAWSDQCERMEEELQRKHRFANVVWFNKLSYDDQILIAVSTNESDFLKRLDETQLNAYRLMKD